LVLASRILDYVSPREVEDWEYNDFLKREEVKRQAQLEAAATPQKAQKKRKPGRPRKGPPGVKHEADQAAMEEPATLDSEAEAIHAEKKAAGRPSLSTPSKRKLNELLRETEAEETGTESENLAIAQQLYSGSEEAGYPSEAQYGEDMDIDSEAVDLLEPGTGTVSSRSSSPVAPTLRLAIAQASPGLTATRFTSSLGAPSGAAPSAATPLRDGAGKDVSAPLQAFRSDLRGTAPAATPPRPVSTPVWTPILGSHTSTHASTPRTSPHFPVVPNVSTPAPSKQMTSFTPVPVPVLPAPKCSTPSATPKAGHDPPPSSQKRSNKKRKPAVQQEEETEWKVKRLEDDSYDYDAEGNLKRFFKVLWEGDWPPSQNPSWEPEENISEDLKKEYLRKKEGKMKNGYLTGKSPAANRAGGTNGSNSAQKKGAPPFLPKKRYSSVAEAFEGDILGLETAVGGEQKVPGDDDDGERDEEERFVVTDEPRQNSGGSAGLGVSRF
jgi:hypothetical protein